MASSLRLQVAGKGADSSSSSSSSSSTGSSSSSPSSSKPKRTHHPNEARLREAVVEKNLDQVKSIISQETDAELRKSLLNGCICTATMHDTSVEVLQHLIENGGDPNEQTERGMFPLHIAAIHGNLAHAELLIRRGAVVNAKSGGKKRYADSVDPHTGSFPLHLAVERSHQQVVELLLRNGADVNLKNDYYNATPLCIAAGLENTEILRTLVEKGRNPDLNKTNRSGATPLYIASAEGHAEMVKFLLAKGADPSVQSGVRKTAKEVAKTEAIAALFS